MEQLIRLQNIDTKLKDLNDLLGDLPSKVEDLNNQEETTKNSIISKKSRSKDLDLEINKTELKVSDLSGKIDKLKDQLFLVTNNKQYDALMAEIDHLKEKRTSSENDLIDAIEKILDTYKKHKRNKSDDFLSVFRRIGIKEFKKDLYDNFTKKA